MTSDIAWLAAIVFVAYGAQTIAGFGSMIIGLTLGAMIRPIPELLPIYVPLSLVNTGAVAIRGRRDVAWPLLLRRIMPLMAVGMAGGYVLSTRVAGEGLTRVFGGMVIILAARELWIALKPKGGADGRGPMSLPKSVSALLGAGVLHGMWATGGPLLVYAVGRSGLNKSEFRATLMMVFFVLNIFLTAGYAADQRISQADLYAAAMLVAPLLVAQSLGEWLHHRIDAERFQLFVYTLLVAAGVLLIVR